MSFKTRPQEAQLSDSFEDGQLVFTRACLPNTPHPFYGIVHYAQSPEPVASQTSQTPIAENIAELTLEVLLDAITKGQTENVKGLLERGLEPWSNPILFPLHTAASLGHLEIVKLLIEVGKGDPNALNSEEEVPL